MSFPPGHDWHCHYGQSGRLQDSCVRCGSKPDDGCWLYKIGGGKQATHPNDYAGAWWEQYCAALAEVKAYVLRN